MGVHETFACGIKKMKKGGIIQLLLWENRPIIFMRRKYGHIEGFGELPRPGSASEKCGANAGRCSGRYGTTTRRLEETCTLSNRAHSQRV